ncbi:GNAT family N-acetyltransferase [Metabacillus sp. FJAT-53654]|uniref:GNAT family N-acetyltransferase n=1 Tax=Metabacillus rhizosphaerae TaxID=3117747 RepID=A0ABZ2MUJ6_9BACI
MYIKLRQATKKDITFLWDMLYEAIYVGEGEVRPPRSILDKPELAHSVENWGRHGDHALIATDSDDNKVGAIWIRLFSEQNKTYGYVNENIPILSMAILPKYRGKGIGTRLIQEICTLAKINGYKAVSLSVDPANPALRLYERFNFKKIGVDGTSWDMKANL